MQITIFGAGGKVGRLCVEEALRRGYSVVAFVHRKNPFDQNPNVKVIQGDIHTKRDVAKALENSDVVISALGSWGTRKKNTLSFAMEYIIPLMQKNSITRVITLTGADARAPGDGLSLLHRVSHMAISIIGRKVLRDGEKHIQMLVDSDLNFTVFRSPIMNIKGNPFHSELSDRRPLPWQTIHRQSVVLAMIQAIEDDQYARKAPYIVRAK